ncbi:hypothetical protein DDZ18_10540 [Marinicauda salina]|uniref:HNH endonuclease n=1 Tax=Marinicauda salina TaxID=2135793 RepID=A0A2U2BT07_9PROT|nr:DUF4357 domain-containing protein [Marinicauda salina]PWE17128.1 hypothetical protein DDZ18_10540 [Marinicauda salina]
MSGAVLARDAVRKLPRTDIRIPEMKARSDGAPRSNPFRKGQPVSSARVELWRPDQLAKRDGDTGRLGFFLTHLERLADAFGDEAPFAFIDGEGMVRQLDRGTLGSLVALGGADLVLDGEGLITAAIPRRSRLGRPIFEFSPQDAHARAQPEIDGRFTVLARSTAMLDGSPNKKRDRPLRDQLLEEGVLAPAGDPALLVFTKDHIFSSPSAAGGVVKDGNCSGTGAWRLAWLGDTLGEWLERTDLAVFEEVRSAAAPLPPLKIDPDAPVDERRKWQSLRVMRQGAQEFREAMKRIWGGACAVTGCTELGTLDAAHIHPYGGPHTNDPRNGLLLRADIHRLFDRLQLTLEPGADSLTIRVAPAVTDPNYRRLDGGSVRPPAEPSVAPARVLLAAHNRRFEAALKQP